jgi:hypothetical protein
MEKVVSEEKRRVVLRKCMIASGSRTRLVFETPCSVDDDTVFPHPDALVVSPKADGVRYLLCLCTDDKARPIATFVNRKEECFATTVSAPESWFRLGCVFDGDMCEGAVEDDIPTHNVYLVFNVLLFRGEEMFARSYRERVSCMTAAVPSELLNSESKRKLYGACCLVSASDAYDIVAKPVRPAVEIRALLEEKLPYPTDGVVFTPLNDGMTTGRNRSIIKWKADNTIDVVFKVHSNNTYELLAATKGRPTPLSDIMTHTFVFCDVLQSIVRGERLFRKLMGLPEEGLEHVIELSVTPGISPLLTFVRLRVDKPTPNDAFTIQRTVASAESAITLDRLCALVLQAPSVAGEEP